MVSDNFPCTYGRQPQHKLSLGENKYTWFGASELNPGARPDLHPLQEHGFKASVA